MAASPQVFNYTTEIPLYPAQLYRSNTGVGTAGDGTNTYYYGDGNIGHNALRLQDGNTPAGAIKIVRDQLNSDIDPTARRAKAPMFTIISDNYSLTDAGTGYTYAAANGRNHTLTVSGSILSKNGVTLGTNINDTHFITGSVNITGSLSLNGSPVGLPYKVCVLNMSCDGSTWTIENTFQDTIGITLTSLNASRFRLTSTGNFTVGKVAVFPMLLTAQAGKIGMLDWTFAPTIDNITIRISDAATGALASSVINKGNGIQWLLEVRVYP